MIASPAPPLHEAWSSACRGLGEVMGWDGLNRKDPLLLPSVVELWSGDGRVRIKSSRGQAIPIKATHKEAT